MPTRQIASSTLWQLCSQVVMAALSILTVKFVALGLTKELAGVYNSAYGYLQLFGILADFGLYAVGVRELSRSTDRPSVLGALIALRLMILMVSLVLALAFVWLLPAWRGTPLPLSVTIAALVPFFTLLAGVLRSVFQVTYRMHWVFVAEVAQRVLTTALIGFFLVMGIRGSHDLHILHLFLLIGGIGAFLLFLISLVAANRMIPVRIRLDWSRIRTLARVAFPFGIAFLCTALYRQFDVTMIALLRPDFDIQNAYYGFVLRMTDMGYIIPTFLLNSVLPTLSAHEEQGSDTRDLLSATVMGLLVLGIVSMAFAVLWSRPLVGLLTTEHYLSTSARPGSDTALRLLGMPMLLNGLIQYGFYALLHRMRWRALVSCVAGAAIVSLALNAMVIPAYGFVGAAWTSIIVHALLALTLFPLGLQSCPVRIPVDACVRMSAFAALLSLILAALTPFLTWEIPTALALTSMVVALPALVFLTGLDRYLRAPGTLGTRLKW